MLDGPNILIFILDTTRIDDLQKARTPNIDDIREMGTYFRDTFSNAPWTLPSHATLLTGHYPRTHNAHAEHKSFDTNLRRLPEAFSDAGYETVAISNNNWFTEEFGFGSGFDTFYKSWQFTQSESDPRRVFIENSGLDAVRELVKHSISGNPARDLVNIAHGAYRRFSDTRSDKGANRSNAFLREWMNNRDSGSPFFAFINYLEPHLEYRPLKDIAMNYLPEGVSFDEAMEVPQDAWGYLCKEIKMSTTDFEILSALHLAEVEYTDQMIGEVIEMLDQQGVRDETEIVITSDHGENIGEHGLMDHQYSLHDTLTHVPLIISKNISGDKQPRFIEHVDFAPTVLEIASIEDEMIETAPGTSVHSDNQSKDIVISEYAGPQPSIDSLEERYSVPQNVYNFDRSLTAIRTANRKLIVSEDGSETLYDVSGDPTAERPIDDPEAKYKLSDELEMWKDRTREVTSEDEVSIADDTQERLEDLGYL